MGDILEPAWIDAELADDLELVLVEADQAELLGVGIDEFSAITPSGLVEIGRITTARRTAVVKAARQTLDAPLREGVNREVEWTERFGPLCSDAKPIVVYDKFVGQQTVRRYVQGQGSGDGLTWFLARVGMVPGRRVRIITAITDAPDRGQRFDEEAMVAGFSRLLGSMCGPGPATGPGARARPGRAPSGAGRSSGSATTGTSGSASGRRWRSARACRPSPRRRSGRPSPWPGCRSATPRRARSVPSSRRCVRRSTAGWAEAPDESGSAWSGSGADPGETPPRGLRPASLVYRVAMPATVGARADRPAHARLVHPIVLVVLSLALVAVMGYGLRARAQGPPSSADSAAAPGEPLSWLQAQGTSLPGIGRVDGLPMPCTAWLLDVGADPAAAAFAVTAGRCAGIEDSATVRSEESVSGASVSFRLFTDAPDGSGQPVVSQIEDVAWASVRGTDLAVLRLADSYGDLSAAGIPAIKHGGAARGAGPAAGGRRPRDGRR